MALVVLDLAAGTATAIAGEGRRHGARAGVAADVLVNRRWGRHPRRRGERAEEPGEVDTLSSGDHALRKVGDLMKADEPGISAALARLGPRAGGHRLQNGQAPYLVWIGRREGKRHRPAPVLSGQQHRAKTELGDKPVQIVGTGGDIVGLRPRIRV